MPRLVSDADGAESALASITQAISDKVLDFTVLANGRILLDREVCGTMVGELEDYRWDAKAAAMGTERPLKQRDHGADALRYAVSTL